jgi:glucose 1-dehydrogenase
MGRLSGKVALVTGASNGIGAAIATALAEEGADIAVNDFGPKAEGEAMVASIRATGQDAIFIPGDVTRMEDCRNLVAVAAEQLGRLDIVVNNAGRARYQKFEEITERDFDAMLDVFLKGPFFIAQAAVPHLRRQGGGRIINICSEQAFIGYEQLTHYTAAKGGLLTLTKSLARALAPTITVNAICPGPTATESLKAGPEYVDEVRDQIPLKRWGQPGDVGRTAVFLATSDGDNYTGQALGPNGGTVMR